MHCDICHLAKQRKLSFSNNNSRAASVLNTIHVDIWGPSPTISLNVYKYFLTIIDDYSRFTWFYLMHNKSETRMHLVNFINYAENQFNARVKIIRSDNGHEFAMKDFFMTKGIIHQTTYDETPEQNRIVERKHQHLLNVTRALLFQSKLSKNFWSYAIEYATCLINSTPTPSLNDCTPYEKMYNKAFDIEQLHVFGCLCYVQTLTSGRKKFDLRAKAGIFCGFRQNTKGYIVYDIKS